MKPEFNGKVCATRMDDDRFQSTHCLASLSTKLDQRRVK